MNNDTQRGYNFHYDDLNRISAADYQNNDANTDKNYSITYVYDNMGNIKNLTRYCLSTKPSTFGMIDNLTLNYNGNQLISLTDALTSEPSYNGAFNFVKASSGTHEYTYDANGNLIRNTHNEIAKIQYNILNLPSALQFTEGHTSEYLYDAAIGRWETVDPLAEKHYNISRYVYCSGNPVNWMDSDGRDEYLLTGLPKGDAVGHSVVAIQ